MSIKSELAVGQVVSYWVSCGWRHTATGYSDVNNLRYGRVKSIGRDYAVILNEHGREERVLISSLTIERNADPTGIKAGYHGN